MRGSISLLLGAIAVGVAMPTRVCAQHEPSPFKMSLVFEGKKQVDGRGKEMHAFTDPNSGRLMSKEGPKSSVALPIKVSFESLQGSELKLSSRDYRFAVLDPEGNVLPGGVMLPYDSDPKTGLPTRPTVREFVLRDKQLVDDPKMSLSLGISNTGAPRLKSGRYTLVCVMQGQIASVGFELKVE